MEQKLEGVVDAGLEQIAGHLYFGGVLLGALLVLTGVYLLVRKGRAAGWKSAACLAVGTLGIICALVQLRSGR